MAIIVNVLNNSKGHNTELASCIVMFPPFYAVLNPCPSIKYLFLHLPDVFIHNRPIHSPV